MEQIKILINGNHEDCYNMMIALGYRSTKTWQHFEAAEAVAFYCKASGMLNFGTTKSLFRESVEYREVFLSPLQDIYNS